MAKCMSCGKSTLFTTTFGKVVLCKNCASIANVATWSKRDFTSIEELMEQRHNAIQTATEGELAPVVINEIGHYFDEYINAGFITTINGKAGQTLKVFSDYCIIRTKNETKKSELENMFYQFDPARIDDYDDDDDMIFTPADAKRLASGLMSGRLLQTGVDAALSATFNFQEKERREEKKARELAKKAQERRNNIGRLITVGERRIELKRISKIEVFSRSGCNHGYLKFVEKGANPNTLYDCEYFFFNNSIPFESKRIKQKLESVGNILRERLAAIEQESQRAKKEKTDVPPRIKQILLKRFENSNSYLMRASFQKKSSSLRRNNSWAYNSFIFSFEQNSNNAKTDVPRQPIAVRPFCF